MCARPTQPLGAYRAKRNFAATPEPQGDEAAKKSQGPLAYVIQKHAATRLHYDLRLEHGGVMWSWAVPKGPSYDPTDKRVAIKTEDHPISYNRFEGTIPKGQYGAGTVLVWDRGHWEPAGDPAQGLAEGKLLFTLHGQKLHGQWELVRIKPKDNERQDPWILFKKRDGYARPREDYDVVRALPDSVGPEPEVAAAAAVPAKARTGRSKAARKVAGLPLPEAAVPAALPASLSPQLATQASGLPPNGKWIFEIKFDGYRMLARFDGAAKPRLFTRNGHDWSSKMPVLIDELHALGLKGTWLDGEVVVLGPDGLPDFNALQNAFDGKATRDIRYFVFDVPYFEGHDLRAAPLRERRALLAAWLATTRQRTRALQQRIRCRPGEPDALGRTAQARRAHRQARRCAIRVAAHRQLAQAQAAAAPGVRDRRLHRPRRRRGVPGDRQLAARRARRPGPTGAGGQRRHRLVGQDSGGLEAAPRQTRDAQDPLCHRTRRQQTLGASRRRVRALGQAATGGRDRVCRLDTRRPHPPRQVRGPAQRHAGQPGGA